MTYGKQFQSKPVRTDGPPVWELVIAEVGDATLGLDDGEDELRLLVIKDMQERHAFGVNHYGVPLQAHNGRDALCDLYEEALDFVVYARQVAEEGEHTAWATGLFKKGLEFVFSIRLRLQERDARNSLLGGLRAARPSGDSFVIVDDLGDYSEIKDE